MIKTIKITDIKPADYNPRRISETQFEELQKSLSIIGFSVPILVNRKNNVIIAGHQRTKAATALGIKEVPAIFIDNVSAGDEIKFNQLHNGVDAQRGFECSVNTTDLPVGEFLNIDIKRFNVKKTGATYVKEICNMLLKYGNVLTCVICRGEVIIGANYVKACSLLNYNPICYIIEDSLWNDAKHFLKADYGEYSYSEIKRNTYVQGLAQMHRNLEKGDLKKANKSSLYMNYVLPYLAQHNADSILDFGCGKATYITHLMQSNPNAVGVEFYNNNGSAIDISKGNRMIDRLIKYLEEYKNFEVVVCDSVLNSVDSVEAERAVMGCLNLFCRDRLFISGRPLNTTLSKLNMSKDKSARKYVNYLDDQNFTGDYRKGNWYFQHFHDKKGIEKLMHDFGFEIVRMTYGVYGDSFQVEAVKKRELTREEYIQAVDFEFNLPLPGGKSYGRNEEVKKVLGLG